MGMLTSAATDGTERALSRALAVALRSSGLSLCSYDERPPLDLRCPDLALLEELALAGHASTNDVVLDVAGRAAVDPASLFAFVGELQARGLLAHGEASPTAEAGSTSAFVDPLGPTGDGTRLRALTPFVFRLTQNGFELLDHDGLTIVRLGAVELAAASEFRVASTGAAALERHRVAAGPLALEDAPFAALVDKLRAAGVVADASAHEAEGREIRDARLIYGYFLRLGREVDAACETHEAAERAREQATGTARVRVVPIDDRGNPIPLALGMLLAHAKGYKGGLLEEHYQFVPQWLTRAERLPKIASRPGIFLFSNYIWSHGQNLAHSEELKRLSPSSLMIHGGPDAPKYEGDVQAYFRANPSVDIAVHGEGEATLAELLEALIGAVGDGPTDLSCLQTVAGLSYRDGDGVVRTAKRDRLVDLDEIPSPFLAGLFDVHADAGTSMAIVETNRGCPYGCTFCDWGSATLSRIRKFDLERIYGELEWCARRHIPRLFLADANFGIMERDVEIAEKIAELKAIYGFPTLVSTNYAKNTTKHLKQIVQTFVDADILIQGLLSLQSMDAETLKTVKRSNIKTAKYDELAHEFRQADLPLFVDLMLGLPGATQASFRGDLQGCIDREVTAKIYPTELLVNSPMNEPEYRENNRIETSAPLGALVATSRNADGSTKRALVVATASFTRADYDEMLDLRRVFIVADNFGVLRQVSRFVRQELGLTEIELYERLRLDARAHPDRWPALAFTFRVMPFLGTPPVSWRLLVDETRAYVTKVLTLPDDDALDTVLLVQHALLPSRGRQFPVTLELAHDYAAWHRAMVEVKDAGFVDWEGRVPRLRDLPPGRFTVDDPHDVCGRALGVEIDENLHGSWELASPVARAVSHEHMWDA
jgi:hypothetical protein